MSHVSLARLPFAGLGFDLSLACAHAMHMVPRRVRFHGTTASARPPATIPASTGYALLLELSREIRGR